MNGKLFIMLCYLIGVVQLVLGGLYLLVPQLMIGWQGLGPIPADVGYPLAMLAARFLVYGAGMFVIAANPAKNRPWIAGMIVIQLIDLGAGLAYVATGVVAFSVAAFPMMNAAIFAVGLYLLRPRAPQPAHA